MSKKEAETKPVATQSEEIEPWRPFDIESVFSNMFDDFWGRPFPRLWRRAPWSTRALTLQAPALDLYEQNDSLIVKAEIPGLTKDEIDISLEGNTLTIKGEKKKEEEVKQQDYYRCERTFGAFSRSVDLPMDVQTDKVNATFKNGVLEIRLPKTEEAKKNVVKVKVA